MAHDNCDGCGQDYDFRRDVDFLVIYPKNDHFNHVLAICPNCDTRTTIFIEMDALFSLIPLLTIKFFATVQPKVRESRRIVDGEPKPEDWTEPEPKWLSPRLERYIDYFRDQLDRGEQE